MSILLPTSPCPTGAQPKQFDFGGDLTPWGGGEIQNIDRLGTRFSMVVSLPPLWRDEAGVWVSRLLQAKRSSAVLAFPQLGDDVGDEGVPRVNGAGQAGTFLAIDGLPANKPVKEGWFFSILTGGRRYLHCITADVVASPSGEAILSIEPMLRIIPADNAVVELAEPKMEGMVQGGVGWDIDLAIEFGLSFTLVERE